MKQILVVVFLLSALACVSQTLTIDSIPQDGILLNKGWKFQKGDNAAWAKPDFNDTDWEFINPVLDVHHSLPQIPKKGICWLRLRLSIDSALLKKQMSLIIQQSIASEIYLNGALLYKFGELDNGTGKVKAYDPISNPALLPPMNNTGQLLAVRFALEPGAHYTAVFRNSNNSAFSATLQDTTKAFKAKAEIEKMTKGYNGFMVGLLLLLLLIHSAYYYFYPEQKANLYFSIYASLFLINNVRLLFFNNHDVAERFYFNNLTFIIIIAINLFLLTAIYKLLEQKKDWMYWSLLILAGPAFIINLLQYSWGWHIGADLMTLLVNIVIAKLTIRAVKRKKKGAWLLAGGAICCLLFFLLFVIVANLRPDLGMLANIFFLLTDLSIPVTTSLYLGLDFGFVSIALKQKLNEVTELSNKSLRQEQEKQHMLAEQNEILETQVTKRTAALNQSLSELKSTQAQLIQSEKMASLGELTAGIAHEIQNPLNFVNNFSEVNDELINEMNDEMDKGNIREAKSIAYDLQQNLEKINHHGKRADAIVKNMLQHSRSCSSQKELTDINKLADEYLRLSYHGMRAKEKNFNATIKTDFDRDVSSVEGKMNIIPQDIGRVLLNLYNNAFYALAEKMKNPQPLKGSGEYQPSVMVSTRYVKSPSGDLGVLISVKDNGDGIPQKIVDKIFQPFFTTKPSGQGTGLGLSLSYDIIKAHGGEIKVETKEGQGSIFIIQIPFTG